MNIYILWHLKKKKKIKKKEPESYPRYKYASHRPDTPPRPGPALPSASETNRVGRRRGKRNGTTERHRARRGRGGCGRRPLVGGETPGRAGGRGAGAGGVLQLGGHLRRRALRAGRAQPGAGAAGGRGRRSRLLPAAPALPAPAVCRGGDGGRPGREAAEVGGLK